MPTAPFTPAFISRLENRTHAYRLGCITGEVVSFKFFCCEFPYPHSVTKVPVVEAIVDPDIVCVNDDVSVDIRTSYMPLGTLDTYQIWWGDGAGTGVLVWPPAGPTVYVGGYAAAGTYDIRIEVTETLAPAITGNLTVQVLAIDCTLAAADSSILAEHLYALSQTTGPWHLDVTAAIPAWVQHIYNLAGNWLNGRDLKIDPHRKHLPVGGRHIWIATQGGVAKSEDNMDHWETLYDRMPEPRNDDGGIATKAGLDWYCITFNPREKDRVYVLAGTVARSWVYWTVDDGVTWDNWQVSSALPIENDELMAFWRFEEVGGNRADCVGANTLYDNATVTQAAGHIGFAAQFTAVNQEFLNALDNDDLSIGYDESFTVAMWVRADAWAAVPPAAGTNWIFSKWNAGEGRSYTLHYRSTVLGSNFQFEVGAPYPPWTYGVESTFGNPAINTWYLIVCWHDGYTGAIYIQVDNGVPDVEPAALAGFDNAADLTVGTTTRFAPAGTQWWDGRIDAMGFWKRRLTTAERTYLWNAGAGREICTPAPDWVHTPIGGGLYPQAMDCDADGDALYLGLYNGAVLPELVQVDLPLVSTAVGNLRFAPGAGDAINVKCTGISDNLVVSGWFGAGEQVEASTDGGVTWVYTDPAGWLNNRAQPLIVPPLTTDEVMVALDAAQEIHETFDIGVTWIQRNAAIGFTPGAMVRLVNGTEMIIGDGAGVQIDYSPNRGATTGVITGVFGGFVAALEIT